MTERTRVQSPTIPIAMLWTTLRAVQLSAVLLGVEGEIEEVSRFVASMLTGFIIIFRSIESPIVLQAIWISCRTLRGILKASRCSLVALGRFACWVLRFRSGERVD